jgi:hypothetical protein
LQPKAATYDLDGQRERPIDITTTATVEVASFRDESPGHLTFSWVSESGQPSVRRSPVVEITTHSAAYRQAWVGPGTTTKPRSHFRIPARKRVSTPCCCPALPFPKTAFHHITVSRSDSHTPYTKGISVPANSRLSTFFLFLFLTHRSRSSLSVWRVITS